MLIAIDPGCYDSGVVVMNGDRIISAEQRNNDGLISQVQCYSEVIIESLHFMGGSVGREVLDTCVWVGRFMQAAGPERVTLIRRDDLRYHWVQNSAANDASVRAAVIDHYGGKEIAIGTKKNPGPLYGISGHCWQALALGLAYQRGCRSKVFTRKDKIA